MGPKTSTCIVIFSIMVFYITAVSAFNITRLLDQHPEFSMYNNLLTQTGVAAEINTRRTITVLVMDNSEMGSITSKPQDIIKKIMETHSLLEYYDTAIIGTLSKNGSTVTNFFQNSGLAYKKQGETQITASGGGVIFSSAMEGAPQNSKMVKDVASQTWNISVIQISQPIVTPGIDQTAPSSPSVSPKASPAPMAGQPPKKANQIEAPTSDDGMAADAPENAGPTATEGPSAGRAPGGIVADKEHPAKKVPPAKGSGVRRTASGAVVLGLMGLLVLSL